MINKTQVNNSNASSKSLVENELALVSKDLIEHNIRISKLREIRDVQDAIDCKIKNVEVEINRILENEDKRNFDRNEVIKTYIENFN